MINDNSFFRRTIIRQVLIFLFWIAGVSVSTAVIAWVRLFKLIFGDTFFITSLVLITFLMGLAIGSYKFGKKIDQKRNELKSFLWFELTIGIYLLLIVIIFPILKPLNKFIFVTFREQAYSLDSLKFLIIFLLLITPSTLIGATFPILSRFFIQSSARTSREIGNLYGINAFGASIGCLLVGFLLLHILGIKQALIFSAITTLFNAGVVKFLLNKIAPTIHNIETEFYDQQLKHLAQVNISKSVTLKKLVTIGIAISAFLSTSYLILWAKSLIYITGNNTYSIHIPIAMFFAGLTIGAFFYPRFLERGNLFSIFAIIQIIIGIFGIISTLLIPQLHPLNENLLGLLKCSNSWICQILIHFYDSVLLFLLPTILIGMIFPLVVKLYLTDYEERGKTIGSIYTAKFLGAIGGLILTAFVFIQYVGIQKSFILLALINFLIGLVILLLLAIKYGNIIRTSLVFGIVAVIFILSLLIPSNRILKLFENQNIDHKVVYIKEGIYSTVAIYQRLSQKQLSLAADGVNIGGTSKESLTIQRLCGHLPLLLHHYPETVLTIGFRDGETLTSIFMHPVKWVDCVEKKSDIIKAFSLINGERNNLVSNRNLHIISMTGKYYALSSNKKYDVIINDIAHPAFAGNSSLYSEEHFRACRTNLKDGGVMSSVIPLFKMSIEDFKVMINTFHSIFPTMTLWYPNNYLNQYAILIGSTDPEFKIDYKKIEDGLNEQGIMANLAPIGMDNVYELLDSFIFGGSSAKGLIEGVRLNRDNLPHLEFSCPKTADSPSNWHQLLQLLANYREPVYPYLTNIDSNLEQREFVRLILENYYKSTQLVFTALDYELLGNSEKSLQIYRQVYMMNRFDRGAKRFLDTYYDPKLIDSPQSPAEYVQNATVLFQKMEYEEAINLVNKALEINPDYAPAYFALGINYEIMGEFQKARKMYQQTLIRKPNLQQAKDRLDSLASKRGN